MLITFLFVESKHNLIEKLDKEPTITLFMKIKVCNILKANIKPMGCSINNTGFGGRRP